MEEKCLRVRANAKVNLALHITGQQLDGRHILDSLVAFPDFGDELYFEKADDLSLSVSGPFGNELLQENKSGPNIIIKAAQLIKEQDNGAAIKLIKNLPLASGIGGGSSDAAVTLKTLSRLWNKKMPELKDILDLGSDVPVCLSNELQRMQGIGEIRTVLDPPPPMWIVLANPGVRIPTAKIFNYLKSKHNGELEPFQRINDLETFFQYLKRQRNDLESVTTTLFPEVDGMLEVINETLHCKLCRMSGSGATCFGLYTRESHAIEAEEKIKESFSKAWAVSAPLFSINSRNNIVG